MAKKVEISMLSFWNVHQKNLFKQKKQHAKIFALKKKNNVTLARSKIVNAVRRIANSMVFIS